MLRGILTTETCSSRNLFRNLQMSSYFLNSFSGRYPNGSDYQLLNYGTNGAMNGSYRDSTNMHPGSFGYTYNGIDLSVNRSNNNAHFGGVGESGRAFQSPGADARYRQTSCSLASPEPLPCPNNESLSLKGSSPSSEQSTAGGGGRLSGGAGGGSLTSSTSSTHFVETDEANVVSEPEDGAQASNANPRAQKQDSVATSTTAPGDGQSPQIFPWMRKLHISHGSKYFWCFDLREAQMVSNNSALQSKSHKTSVIKFLLKSLMRNYVDKQSDAAKKYVFLFVFCHLPLQLIQHLCRER